MKNSQILNIWDKVVMLECLVIAKNNTSHSNLKVVLWSHPSKEQFFSSFLVNSLDLGQTIDWQN